MSQSVIQLTRPDLLSELELQEILKARCIETSSISKSLKKKELVEMYKKVVLPLPQRQYNEARPLGRHLNQLRLKRKIPISVDEDVKLSKLSISGKESNDTTNNKTSNCERLQSSNDSMDCESSSAKDSTEPSDEQNGFTQNNAKRKNKNTEVSAQSGNKRQKITWP